MEGGGRYERREAHLRDRQHPDNYRYGSNETALASRNRLKAYDAATKRLRELHPAEFKQFYNEERKALGLEPTDWPSKSSYHLRKGKNNGNKS